MNWNQTEGHWKQRRKKAVHHYGKVISDLLAAIASKYKELVARLQKKYGIAKEEARRKLERLKRKIKQLKEPGSAMIEVQQTLSEQKNESGKPVKLKTSVRKKTRARTNG